MITLVEKFIAVQIEKGERNRSDSISRNSSYFCDRLLYCQLAAAYRSRDQISLDKPSHHSR